MEVMDEFGLLKRVAEIAGQTEQNLKGFKGSTKKAYALKKLQSGESVLPKWVSKELLEALLELTISVANVIKKKQYLLIPKIVENALKVYKLLTVK